MQKAFIPNDFVVSSWELILPYYQQLNERELNSLPDLEAWLSDRDELESSLSEDFAWRYIKTSCHTDDKEKQERFEDFVKNIQPPLQEWGNKLDKKFLECAFIKELPEFLNVYVRDKQNAVKIFRQENIPLHTEEEVVAQEFGALSGALSIEYKGEKLTIQAAGKKLESTDREEREEVYRLLWDARKEIQEPLHEVLTKLVKIRHQIAVNAGFDNFRDYQFQALGRYDYTAEDCVNFHKLIKKYVVPYNQKVQLKRKKLLNLEVLKPWDLAVDPENNEPLKPFEKSEELVDKTIKGFASLDPEFGEFLTIMKEKNYWDLDSRPHKRPGGFLYPLEKSGVPFIFMNAVGSQRDVETLVHEGGHALHAFYTQGIDYRFLRSTPTEVCEVASMAMELLSMEFWDLFYPDEKDLSRAKKEKVEDSLSMLPWICQVDEFQHWLYLNPEHTAEEREAAWLSLSKEYSTGIVEHGDMEWVKSLGWQPQMHIFEVPFYYIEYAFAQLGSSALWINFQNDKTEALNQYKAFMKLGNTKTIPELYKAGGINFEFDEKTIQKIIEVTEEH